MNSASRVLAAINHFQKLPSSTSVFAGWASYIGVTAGEDEERIAELAAGAFVDEIEAMKAGLSEAGAPDTDIADCARRLRHGLSAKRLEAPWDSYRPDVVAPENLTTLRFAAHLLQARYDEEDADEAVKQLLVRIADQEALLQISSLPAGLRHMLQVQLKNLRAALRLYKISGIEPLRRASNEAFGEIVKRSPELERAYSNGSAEERAAMSGAMQTVKDAGAIADAAQKVITAGKSAIEIGQKATEFLLSFFGA